MEIPKRKLDSTLDIQEEENPSKSNLKFSFNNHQDSKSNGYLKAYKPVKSYGITTKGK
jgi:hypothetical protein